MVSRRGGSTGVPAMVNILRLFSNFFFFRAWSI